MDEDAGRTLQWNPEETLHGNIVLIEWRARFGAPGTLLRTRSSRTRSSWSSERRGVSFAKSGMQV
eukprot:5922369-Lingulodinium_polyedra.AAC.1